MSDIVYFSKKNWLNLFFIQQLQALYNYRDFILECVKREFQSRYKTSMAGAAWLFLQPLAMILVYTLIFSQVMGSRLSGLENNTFSYSIYLCSGLLAWTFFSDMLNRGQTLFTDNAHLLKKLKFPKICLLAIMVLATSLDFFIIFGIFLAFLLLSGNFPGWAFLSFFIVLLLQMLFAIGLGVTLGVLNVFFRDVKHFMSIVLQFWFWFTPVIYPIQALPDWASHWLIFNPMFGVISAYHNIFLNSLWPDFTLLWPAALCAVFFCCLSLYLFRQHIADIVDEL